MVYEVRQPTVHMGIIQSILSHGTFQMIVYIALNMGNFGVVILIGADGVSLSSFLLYFFHFLSILHYWYFKQHTREQEPCCIAVMRRCFPSCAHFHRNTVTQRKGDVNVVKRRIRGSFGGFFVFYLHSWTWEMELWEQICAPVCRCLRADREWKLRHMLIRCCDDGRAEGVRGLGGDIEHWREERRVKRKDFSRQSEREEISETARKERDVD